MKLPVPVAGITGNDACQFQFLEWVDVHMSLVLSAPVAPSASAVSTPLIR